MYVSKALKKCALILSVVMMLSLLSVGGANASMVNSGKFVGNIIAGSAPSNFATYWNQVTPENGTKWGSVEGSRGVMNWGQGDTCFNYAKSHGFTFKFHTLVWGSQYPSWITSLSSSDQKAEVTQWIQAAGAKYSQADYVDVVNEPLHSPPPFANALGGAGSTGWDWIVWSFQQARAAFPNSKLFINEYGIISDPNAANRYVGIINILKSRGLIDGIGIQCHQFNMDTVSVSTMNQVLGILGATGLPVYVSELDITGDDSTQASRYQQKFPVLYESPYVAGVTLWGYIQGQTWVSNTHLIRSDGSERPALTWLKSYLAGKNSATPTPTPSSATPTPTPSSATPTPTPSTATATPTPSGATATPTPTPGTPAPGGIKVQFFNGNTAATTNTIYPNFKVVNTGTASVNLSDVKVRYYFTNDGTQANSFACDYSTIGAGNVTGSFTTIAQTNADRYLEVGFTSGAGTLAAGAGAEVKSRVWKSDWSNFTQTNDYSFNATATNYVDAATVTGYIAGALKWGTEP